MRLSMSLDDVIRLRRVGMTCPDQMYRARTGEIGFNYYVSESRTAVEKIAVLI